MSRASVLHQRDNDKLIASLKGLRDLGNTLIVVEHDEDTMFAADYIVDVGPGAGVHGGEIVCAGSVEDIMACPRSITGAYLSGRKKIEIPKTRRHRQRELFDCYRSKGEQSQGNRCKNSTRNIYLCHRSFGKRQELTGK